MRQKGFALLPIIIIIVLVGVLGYFIYQNTQLRSDNVNPSPTITNSATNLTKLSPSSDSTADWKTYQHTSCGSYLSLMPFSIKIPYDWTESIQGGGDKGFTSYIYQNKNTSVTVTCGSGFGGGGCGELYPEVQNEFLVDGKEIGGCMESNQTNKTITLRLTYLIFDATKPGFSFEALSTDTPENRDLINRILSTFKYPN